MFCVVCLKNNASLTTLLCQYCGNVPIFQKSHNKIDKEVIREFAKLTHKEQTEIIKLTNRRLNLIVKMNLEKTNDQDFDTVVGDFSLKYIVKEYVELAQLGLDLKMTLKRDKYWATKTKYHQYSPPRDLI